MTASSIEESTMSHTAGIHHITAISGDPARNVAFYTEVLGLRMVKKTVNFDDPGTYHLYYGNGQGSPGTILTFFPWAGARPGRRGAGEASGAAFAIPPAAISFWLDRLAVRNIPHEMPVQRFGETVITLSDPDGMTLELVAQASVADSLGWSNGDIPEQHAIRGFAGITIWSPVPDVTGAVLSVMGYTEGAKEGEITRWTTGQPNLATNINVRDARSVTRHQSGAGTVHHVAYRAADDTAQAAMAEALRVSGLQVTEQLDRNYFRSVYFREPGGTLFEIATDAPGFAVDEPQDKLGETLMLPEWLEPRRAAIEAALPSLKLTA
jgi:glyoxalase family protein